MLAAALALAPLLVRYVPDLMKWLGGDRAEETAHDVINVVRTVTGGATDQASVAAALADPSKAGEIALGLARIAADREKAKDEALTARILAANADTASARAQTISLAASGSRIAYAPPVVSALVVVGFFLCIIMLFVVERSWDERTAGLMNALFGALTISFGQVCNYWLGSSRGSAAKDERQEAASVLLAASASRTAEAHPAPTTDRPRRLFERDAR